MRSQNKKRYIDGLTILKKLCSKLNEVDAYDIFEVLSECQQYIVVLGNELEKESHKEDFANLIPELENFAEQIYIVSENGFSEDGTQLLVDEVQNIIDLLEKISCRKEVVFLPYKASMWDAFDSVYKAAIKDVGANVIVMPIPYRSLDKKTGCWIDHYEGEWFPENIQITDYREYDLETMRPDFVFIHNPYDQYNYVTRVHEEFFSSNLINYTGHLVYIPYDVVLGSKIDENYCKMPGVQNAWRVIVQSESVREDYIKWVSPEKVLALGSPKIDAVVNYEVDWDRLPDTWKEKCENKKVFLYNTHLNGIISDGYLLIKRLQNVWDYFHEHQDITLLWRPHPLSVQTAEAMNPDFLRSYLQMVERFKSLNNCIYDDTPDLNRAIGLSDAYMGDYSSLVMLYGFTGKPIYVHSPQNRNMGELERNSLLCDNGVIHDGILWMTHNLFNGLFKVDIYTGQAEFVTEIYGENRNQESLFRDIIFYKGRLFLIPQTAHHIVEHDIETGRQRAIRIENKAYCQIHFSVRLRCQNEIYLFPLVQPNPGIKLDLDNFTIEEFDIDYKTINQYLERTSDMIFGECGVQIRNELWDPLRTCPILVCFSEHETKYYKVMSERSGFRNLSYCDPYFYLTLNGRAEIIIWNPKNGIKERIKVPDNILGVKNSSIENIIMEEENIWIVPARGTNIIRYSLKDKTYKKILNIMDHMEGFSDYDEHWDGVQYDEKNIYLFPYRTNLLLIINKKEDTFKLVQITLPGNMKREEWLLDQKQEKEDSHQGDYSGHFFLDSTIALDTFVSYAKGRNEDSDIIEKKTFCKFVVNSDGTAGEKIFRMVIKGESNHEMEK